jgi:aspartyl protease family protein
MRSVVSFAAAAIVAGIVVPRYAQNLNLQHARAVAEQPASASQPDSPYSYTVAVSRDGEGHFSLDGRVDGTAVHFLVDTGASTIALTAGDAALLGIHPGVSDYTVMLRTANGTVRAAPATLDMVEVGDIMVRNVAAVVLPEGALSESLLGMSFLSRLHSFDYSGGKMVLEQ